MDSIMLLVAHVNYSIIGAKAICMQCRRQLDFAANNGLQTGLFAVRDDLRIDTTIPFINAKDDSLASCTTSSLATDAPSPEVRFIQFDITRERRLSLAVLSDSLANQCQITVDRIAIQTS